MSRKKLHIIIADDHQLFAEGLMTLLKDMDTEIKFTHIFRGDSLVKELEQLQPDLILLDIKMPGLNGIEVLDFIQKNSTSSFKIIMLSTYSDAETINICLDKGADAFMLKNVGIQELKKTIRNVLENKNEKKKIGFSDDEKFNMAAKIHKITKREWQILQLIKIGETNQVISKRLNISIYTTETHRKNIMQKLKLKSPAELIRFLIENNY